MTSSAASNSSRASIPPTSRPSSTRSNAPCRNDSSSTETSILTIVRPADAPKPLLEQASLFAGPAVALIAIWAVHSLTKRRDREKAVFDLYTTVGAAMADLKPIIVKAWGDEDPTARKGAVAETIWRLQQIGGFAERIRRQSSRWAWRGVRSPRPLQGAVRPTLDQDAAWRRTKATRAMADRAWRATAGWSRHVLWPPGWMIEIRLTSEMAALRDAITADPFDDPDRGQDISVNESVEHAIGGFLQALDERLFVWMDAGRK